MILCMSITLAMSQRKLLKTVPYPEGELMRQFLFTAVLIVKMYHLDTQIIKHHPQYHGQLINQCALVNTHSNACIVNGNRIKLNFVKLFKCSGI